jgi:aarF domain-containing kinase
VAPYDPVLLSTRFRAQPLSVAARVLQVSTAVGSVGGGVPVDLATGGVERNQGHGGVHFRRGLTGLGPTFIKVGQALSTRPDLLPAVYLEELAELQDALPGFPDSEAFAIIESELGKRLEEVYERISPQPIAAASLGQVYRAQLRGSGASVAVKVQRPRTAAGLELDFYVLRALAGVADEVVTSLHTSLTAAVDDFAAKVFTELDYVAEGRNAERFAALYASLPRVIVPSIYWEASSSRVLTLQWIDGIKLSDTQGLQASGLSVVSLVDVGIQCSLRQLLTHGYFHADPHPGNLLGTPEGNLAWLDFGIMSECPTPARQAIIAHVVHLVNRDYAAMAEDYYALGFLDRSVDTRPIVPALASFFDDVLTASVSDLNFKTITDGLGAILYAYPFNVPAYYALILRSLTVLEGLALSADPQFKVLAAAYPYFAAQLLTSDAPALRSSLTELLFADGSVRWGRLENLLAQAKLSSSTAGDVASGASAMRPEALATLADVILGPDEPASSTEGSGAAVVDPGASPLRLLLEKEASRAMEALLLGAPATGDAGDDVATQLVNALVTPYQQGPTALALPPFIARQMVTSPAEREQLAQLRASVLRCAALLWGDSGSGSSIDVQQLVAVTSQPRVSRFLAAVAQRLAQRTLARGIQAALSLGQGRQEGDPGLGAAVAR